jgi:nitroreductase
MSTGALEQTVAGVHALDPGPVDLVSVVASASRAPSIHNTQPWRWTSHDGVLDVRADRARQLRVADRDGHSLLISCGAAAALTELALRAQGWAVETALLPDPDDLDLLARLRPHRRDQPDQDAVDGLAAALERRSERRPFAAGAVSTQIVDRLRDAVAAPGVYAHFPIRSNEYVDLAVAISQADRSERGDPAYAAEMAMWVRRGRSEDGVPSVAIPRVPAGQPRQADIPLRDFEAGVPGGQLIKLGVDEKPLIAVIFTEGDSPLDQLRAGQAMMRLMVQAELDGIATCPLSQSVDLLAFRSRLRTLMSWDGHPQMMLRLGHRPAAAPAPLTSRRPVADVLTIA